ncbi:MAG: hypothetical protein NVSMB65_10870 [Chloroflexota bacterium]
MTALQLTGSCRVGAGTYREVHSGHLIYLGTEGYLPGQVNSEHYVKVPDELYFNRIRKQALTRRFE